MFYLITVEDYVRVKPKLFGLTTEEAIEKQLGDTYEDYLDKKMGSVVSVVDILDIGKGIIIPGDGAAYYKSRFKLLTWKPEMQELVYGIVDEITNFGAFMNLGAMNGLVHISQTMDDYVSFSKSNTLAGKSSNRSLKKGDECLLRIVAISHKEREPKIGMTMRQPGLGTLKWIKDDKRKSKQKTKGSKGKKKEEKKK